VDTAKAVGREPIDASRIISWPGPCHEHFDCALLCAQHGPAAAQRLRRWTRRQRRRAGMPQPHPRAGSLVKGSSTAHQSRAASARRVVELAGQTPPGKITSLSVRLVMTSELQLVPQAGQLRDQALRLILAHTARKPFCWRRERIEVAGGVARARIPQRVLAVERIQPRRRNIDGAVGTLASCTVSVMMSFWPGGRSGNTSYKRTRRQAPRCRPPDR